MDQFEVLRVVGRGTAGVVRLCRRWADGELVIVKQVALSSLNKHERQAACNEIEVLDKVKHPNVVSYLDHFIEDGSLMIVMEYADSGSLFDYLQDRQEPLPESTVLRLFVQILIALDHVHKQHVLHRDLKTQNIFLHSNRQVVKIGDFGISKLLDSKSHAQSVVGTPCYISPELLENKAYGPESDVWALGCVLYELMALKRAFDAPNLPALVLKIMEGDVAPLPDTYSAQLQSLVHSMLTVDTSVRPTLPAIMAAPVVQTALIDMMTDMCSLRTTPSPRAGKPSTQEPLPSRARVSRVRVQEWSRIVVVQDRSTTHLAVEQDFKVVTGAVGVGRVFAVTDSGSIRLWRQQSMVSSSSSSPSSSSSSASTATRGVSKEQGTDAASTSSAVAPTIPTWVPRRVRGLSSHRVQRMACGRCFAALITDKGLVLTFGRGDGGVLGQGNTTDIPTPTLVPALLGYEAVDISCGATHTAVITTDSHVFTWGTSALGALGCGPGTVVASTPRIALRPHSSDTYARVRCGHDATAVVTSGGAVWIAGANRSGRLGVDPARFPTINTFTPWSSLSSHIIDVGIGADHVAMITRECTCLTCGDNTWGQLGRNTFNTSSGDSALQPMSGLDDKSLVMVACGFHFTAVVTSNHEVFVCGSMRGTDDKQHAPEPTTHPTTHTTTHTHPTTTQQHHVPRLISLATHTLASAQGEVRHETVVAPSGKKQVVEVHASDHTLLVLLALRVRSTIS